MIEVTRQRVSAAGFSNVAVEQRDFLADGCGAADASIAYAMLFNILHIEQPVDLLRERYRAMVPGGKVGVIYWNYDASTLRGPSMDIRPRNR